MKHTSKTLIALAIAAATSQAHAAGFQLNSQSATGIGRAFAGDAVIADNASVLSRNPAAMAMFDRPELSVGAAIADVKIKVSDAVYHGLIDSNLGSIDDAGSTKVIPNIYYIHPINNKWAVGVAAFSNFGTGTDTSGLNSANSPGFQNQFLGNTELTTINFNASVSYRINEQLSLGAGIDIIHGAGEIHRGEAIPTTGSLLDVDADGIGIGGIVGATYELNKDHRFGLSYRFSPTVNASGDVKKFGAAGLDEIDVPVPDIFQIAGYHKVASQVALHYTAQWTGWSEFDRISSNGGEEIKVYNWDDSWLFSVGATYYLNPQWELRVGYMHDQGVVGGNSEPSISIPDSDRNWYTAGASWHFSKNSTVDFGLAVVRGKDVNVVEQGATVDLGGGPVSTGALSATTNSNAIYYSLQYNYRF
ncbi:outer membrane protein transport protein [Aliagarivorans taiwanensis]|uniref:outer membrane protein transport protein n=1 Tax=Aliagarivorans taiwanensis TaxID=561966 RepID=UPI0003FF9B25|nr:porin [Aliagarivorans taiwanensis]